MALLAMVSVFRSGAREECHNIASNVGTHPSGALAFECSPFAIPVRYLLVQKSVGDNQIATNSATSRPWGVLIDEPGVGDMATVLLCGCAPGTIKMVANAAIFAGSPVYTAAGGKVSPTFGPTLYMVGRAVTAAAADGDLIEVAHCFPLLNSAAL